MSRLESGPMTVIRAWLGHPFRTASEYKPLRGQVSFLDLAPSWKAVAAALRSRGALSEHGHLRSVGLVAFADALRGLGARLRAGSLTLCRLEYPRGRYAYG